MNASNIKGGICQHNDNDRNSRAINKIETEIHNILHDLVII